MTNILILGGGFSGIRAALDLEKKLKHKKGVKITLVNREDFHTFTPLLYEIALAHGTTHQNHPYHEKLRSVVSIPFREIFNGKKIEIVQAEIKKIDLSGKKIMTGGGKVLEFNFLVLALGSNVSTYDIPGVREYAYKFKTVNDAIGLFDKIEELYDAGTSGKKSLPINFIVAGGGFTGIEIAAELAMCSAHAAHRHRIFEENCSSIVLVEAKKKILPQVSNKERAIIRKRLEKLGVTIMENSHIEEVGSDWARVGHNKFKADMVVWTAGVKSPDLILSTEGLKLDEGGRMMTNEYLQLNDNPKIFGVGDNIIFNNQKTGRPVPQMAYTAIDQGRVVAENIARLVSGKNNLKKYNPGQCTTWVAPVGGKNAVAHIKGLTVNGFWGHLAREAIDLSYFLSILPFGKAIKRFAQDIGVALKK